MRAASIFLFIAIVVLIPKLGRAEIAESEAACKPLAIGNPIPNASLVDMRGKTLSLNAMTAGKPTVLVFFRGTWCPLCTQALSHVGKAQADLERLGFQIIAISGESPSDLANWQPATDPTWTRPAAPENETKRKEFERTLLPETALKFTIVCDPDASVAEAFGIAFYKDLVGTEYQKLKKVDLIGKKNGRSWLPLPGVFIVDAKGIIRFVDLNRTKEGEISTDYSRRIRAEALINAAKRISVQ